MVVVLKLLGYILPQVLIAGLCLIIDTLVCNEPALVTLACVVMNIDDAVHALANHIVDHLVNPFHPLGFHVAVGVSPNPLVPKSIEGLELGRKNTIAVSEEMQSSRAEIFAGGDIVRGGATVILAMGDGRRAALNMDKHLQAAE